MSSRSSQSSDDIHRAMMERALVEARRGLGRTRPNPAVGCVIARGSEIIATAYHRRAGELHAEAAALKRAGDQARGADVYVSLEPCDHQGRTGPCTSALVAAGVGRVFVAMRDPNPLVNGRGIRRLRQAGIRVEVGLCEQQAREVNEAFVHRMQTGRPFVVAKLAQSLDGRVATRQGDSQWITSEPARRLGHRLRAELDAIVVGVGTVLADDPKLTCRLRRGRDPVRVVLDTRARTPLSAQVIQGARTSKAPTWLVVGKDASPQRLRAFEKAGVEIIRCRARGGQVDLDALMPLLAERDLVSLLVEGGPRVMGSFVDRGLVDKVHAFVAPLIIGGEKARSAVEAKGAAKLADALHLQRLRVEEVGPDLHVVGYLRRK